MMGATSSIEMGRPFRSRQWLRCVLLAAAILLVAASSLPADPGAAEAKVTLGPGVFTFPEIASRLSVGGNIVRIHPGLENSAAFVYLKERPWSKAHALLAAGLDLRFRQQPENEQRWEMDRDPVVAGREARWRHELTANMYQQLLTSWRERQLHPLETDRESETRLVNAWFSAMLPSLPSDIVRPRRVVLQVGARTDLPEDLVDRLLDETFRRDPRLSRGSYELFLGRLEFIRQEWDVRLEVNLGLYSHTEGGSVDCSLPAYAAAYGAPDGKPRTIADTLFFGLPGSSGAMPLAGLDRDAVAWLRTQEASTLALMKTERMEKAFRAKSVLPIDALSQFVEAWSRTLDAEAVMELSPWMEAIREGLGHRELAVSTGGQTFALASLWKKCHTWFAQAQEDVLVIRNPLAFVDRAWTYPLAAHASLERRVAARRAAELRAGSVRDRDDPLPNLTFGELRDYYADASGPTAAHWGPDPHEAVDFYRGISGERLDEGRPAFRLFERMPAPDRRKLVARGAVGTADVPLDQFNVADLNETVREQRSLGQPLTWHPAYLQRLSAGRLRVTWQPAPSAGALLIRCWIYMGNWGDNSTMFSWRPVDE